MDTPLRGFEREKNLLRQIYYSPGYFDKYQLFTFAEYISLLYNYSIPESKILEIEKGNGFVSDYFKKAGYTFQTFGINPNLEPDITGNVLELSHLITDFPDIIFCCEVLEYMDFSYFEKSLQEMRKVVKERLIITLPDCRKNFGANLQIRLPKRKVFSIPLFFHTTLGKNICPEHCWELNYTKETSSKNIEKMLEKYFVIEGKGYFHTTPYHNYYVLKKLTP